jgi:hypothetical protein
LAGTIGVASSDRTASATLGPVQISMANGTVAGDVAVAIADRPAQRSRWSRGRIDLQELVDGLVSDPASLIGVRHLRRVTMRPDGVNRGLRR